MNRLLDDTLKSACLFRWSYPIYYMFDQSLGYCCRTPAQYIPPESIDQFGSDVFSDMQYFQDRRQEMLQGQKHSDCSSCWQLEDKKVKSPRQTAAFENKIKDGPAADILEIVLSNTCNAKCVYCNEFYSTSWLAEKKSSNTVSKNYFEKQRNHKLDQLFWQWFSEKAISTVTRIGFIGGEPLLISELYECLEKIDQISQERLSVRRRPEICITTNLSLNEIQLNKLTYWIEKLSQQFKFVIQVSVEAPAEQTEYIRFGTHWDYISKNLDRLFLLNQKYDLEISFLPTLNILAVPTLHLFVSQIHLLHLKYNTPLKIISNTVTDPEILSPLLLSHSEAHFFQKVISELENYIQDSQASDQQKQHYQSYQKYLLEMMKSVQNNQQTDAAKMNQLKSYLQQLDQTRKTSYENTFPELVTVIHRAES